MVLNRKFSLLFTLGYLILITDSIEKYCNEKKIKLKHETDWKNCAYTFKEYFWELCVINTRTPIIII